MPMLPNFDSCTWSTCAVDFKSPSYDANYAIHLNDLGENNFLHKIIKYLPNITTLARVRLRRRGELVVASTLP